MVDISDEEFQQMIGKSWSEWDLDILDIPVCPTETDSVKLHEAEKPEEADELLYLDEYTIMPHLLKRLHGRFPEDDLFSVTICPACKFAMKNEWILTHFKQDASNNWVCKRTEMVVVDNSDRDLGKATTPLYDIGESAEDGLVGFSIDGSSTVTSRIASSFSLDKVTLPQSLSRQKLTSKKTETVTSGSSNINMSDSTSHSKKHSSAKASTGLSSSNSSNKDESSSKRLSTSSATTWSSSSSRKDSASKSHKLHKTASYVLSIPSDASIHNESVENILRSSKQTMPIITVKSKSSEPEFEQLKCYADSSEKQSKAASDTGADSGKFSFRHSSSSSSISEPIPSLTIISEAPKMNNSITSTHSIAGVKEKSSSHSQKGKRTKGEHRKLIPLKERVFNPDVHCGAVVSEDSVPCTRSLTCSLHSIKLKRVVHGRSYPFDSLLAAHLNARGEEKAKSKKVADESKCELKKTNNSTPVPTVPANLHSGSSFLNFLPRPQLSIVGKGNTNARSESQIALNATLSSFIPTNEKHSADNAHSISKPLSSHALPLRHQNSNPTSVTKLTNRPLIIVDEKKKAQGILLLDIGRDFVYTSSVEAPKIFVNITDLVGNTSQNNELFDWNPLGRSDTLKRKATSTTSPSPGSCAGNFKKSRVLSNPQKFLETPLFKNSKQQESAKKVESSELTACPEIPQAIVGNLEEYSVLKTILDDYYSSPNSDLRMTAEALCGALSVEAREVVANYLLKYPH